MDKLDVVQYISCVIDNNFKKGFDIGRYLRDNNPECYKFVEESGIGEDLSFTEKVYCLVNDQSPYCPEGEKKNL